jgi:hypothetical protein
VTIERRREANRDWKRSNKARSKELNVEERRRLKIEVFSHYSDGKMCCAKCGYSDIRALALDHINNNGADERRRLFGRRYYAGTTFYRWLRQHDYPEGYQVLCCNCNWIKKLKYDDEVVYNIAL